MKLKARIEGPRVHRVGYRLFLATRAIDLDLPGFSAQNRVEGGRQVMLAFFEGDQGEIEEFKRFIEADKPPEAVVSSISFQDYNGPVGDTMLSYQKMSAQHLGKGIDAILRMEKKQDRMIDLQIEMLDRQDKMLEKQDKMLVKQEETIGKLDETRMDIVSEIRASTENLASELEKARDKNAVDIRDLRIDLRSYLAEKLGKMEEDISRIKAKIGM